MISICIFVYMYVCIYNYIYIYNVCVCVSVCVCVRACVGGCVGACGRVIAGYAMANWLSKGHVAHHRNGLLPSAHLLTDADGSVATHCVGRPAELRHETQPLQSQRPALGTADGTAAECHALGMLGIGVAKKNMRNGQKME